MKSAAMSIEAIIAALWDAGCILLDDTYNTRYNRAHPEAPPSPLRINIRIAPDGPLARDFVKDIGRHMADSFGELHPRPQFQSVLGIPNAGTVLMHGFVNQWLANTSPIILEKHEDEQDRRFKVVDTENLHYHKDDDVIIIDDLVTALGTKEQVMALIPNKVVAICVLIDRSANAQEVLAKRGIVLHACLDVPSMLAYLISADRITDCQAFEVDEKNKDFCRYMAEHP